MTHSATSDGRDRFPSDLSTGGPSGGEPRNDERGGRAVRLLLFASARQAAGVRQVDLVAATVGEVLDHARQHFGPDFAAVLANSRVWLNGEPTPPETPLSDGDEVAVLPPVSGG